MTENPYENFYGSDSNSSGSEDSADVVVSEDTAVIEDTAQADAVPLEYSINYTDTDASSEHVSQPDLHAETDLSSDSDTFGSSYEWNSDGRETVGENLAPYKAPEISKKRKRSNRVKKTPVALLLVLCILLSSVFGAGSAVLVNYFDKKGNTSSGGLTINQVVPDLGGAGDDTAELSTVQIVERTADAVVEITTEYVKTGSFAQQYIESGAGSGVIIDSTGYIVTNHHVIDNAQKITVTLRSGESFDARLLGSDSQIDLALLKIEADNLTCAVFGNSDTLKVGQRTVAIGNPLGQLGGSVTEGIISALDRDVVVDGQTMNLMQTDTAINPGNSGGGLFDTQGTLIGIVVAKSSGSEVEGLGFAIPVNEAVDVISDLQEFGYVRGRVYTGMEFIDVDSVQLAWMYGLSNLGCYVYSVDRGTNAEEAGFKSGDLILSVDGKEIESSEDIESILNKKAVGDEIVFSVQRNNAQGELTLVLEEYVPNSFADSQNTPDW